jgi:hypothetical protein
MPPEGDITEMAYTVLMNATNDQSQDLKLIASEVQQAAEAQELAKLQQAKVSGPSSNPASPPRSRRNEVHLLTPEALRSEPEPFTAPHLGSISYCKCGP